jgi:hypothetical protein
LFYLVLRELGGGYGREIGERLGLPSAEVFEAIRLRLRSRARSDPHATGIDLDEIDWAAIRAIAPIVLSVMPESEFQIVTGRSFGEVESLLAMAKDRIRIYQAGRGFVTHQRGACVVSLPITALRRNVTLAGVPDADSWNLLMPECARGRRDEFLDEMKAHYSDHGEWHWEERSVESLEELELWVRSRHLEWHNKPDMAPTTPPPTGTG